MLIETLVTFTVHVFYLFDQGWINWFHCVIVNLSFGLHAVLRGDGILTLARRSDTSTPGCAVLLGQDFTVVLNGSHSVVEAIVESFQSLTTTL
ncbi:hypothetical protein JVT61DRAFT_4949 [Boletus reticuloceps]|uniref:Uncharacterized protein n=1 Tax=Boletus reticuloceps TaxID=495285 RepID=A0A8I3AFL2_9AGAM|nr:hypothetical protein JVT61DRAFT_4949 [Boletus reticuloceps]